MSEKNCTVSGKGSGQGERPLSSRDDWNARYSETPDLFGTSPNQFLVETIGELQAGRALDLAAGEGRNAFWLAEKGWQVDAVDLSDVAVKRAEGLAEERGLSKVMTFTAEDLTEYRPKTAAYDLVIVMYLHMPLSQLTPILARAVDAVKPGGTILVVGHDLANLAEGCGGPQNPEVLYTGQDLAAAVGPRIKVDLAERRERFVRTDNGEASALDCVLLGRSSDTDRNE